MGRILAWTPSLTGGIVVVRDPCLHGRFSIGSLCVGPSDTMSWSPTIGLLITPQEPIGCLRLAKNPTLADAGVGSTERKRSRSSPRLAAAAAAEQRRREPAKTPAIVRLAPMTRLTSWRR